MATARTSSSEAGSVVKNQRVASTQKLQKKVDDIVTHLYQPERALRQMRTLANVDSP